MPTIAFSSSEAVNAGDVGLTLHVTHELLLGHALAQKHCVERRFLDKVDVSLHPDFDIVLCGTVNGMPVAEADVISSAPLSHLLGHLNRYAGDLGYDHAYSEVVNDSPHIILHGHKQLASTTHHPRTIRLRRLTLECTFICSNPDLHPFSSSPFASFEEQYDQGLQGFLVTHMMKQYPRIFCPASEQEDDIYGCIARVTSRILARANIKINSRRAEPIKLLRSELKARRRDCIEAGLALIGRLPVGDDGTHFALPPVISLDTYDIVEGALCAFVSESRPIPAVKSMHQRKSDNDDTHSMCLEDEPVPQLTPDDLDDLSLHHFVALGSDLEDDTDLTLDLPMDSGSTSGSSIVEFAPPLPLFAFCASTYEERDMSVVAGALGEYDGQPKVVPAYMGYDNHHLDLDLDSELLYYGSPSPSNSRPFSPQLLPIHLSQGAQAHRDTDCTSIEDFTFEELLLGDDEHASLNYAMGSSCHSGDPSILPVTQDQEQTTQYMPLRDDVFSSDMGEAYVDDGMWVWDLSDGGDGLVGDEAELWRPELLYV